MIGTGYLITISTSANIKEVEKKLSEHGISLDFDVSVTNEDGSKTIFAVGPAKASKVINSIVGIREATTNNSDTWRD